MEEEKRLFPNHDHISVQISVEITVPDLERILHWYHVYKNCHKSKPEDEDLTTKLNAILISTRENESCSICPGGR